MNFSLGLLKSSFLFIAFITACAVTIAHLDTLASRLS